MALKMSKGELRQDFFPEEFMKACSCLQRVIGFLRKQYFRVVFVLAGWDKEGTRCLKGEKEGVFNRTSAEGCGMARG